MGRVHEFYHLKALITLEKVIASVVDPYSGSHKQQLPVVQIPQAKISRILDASNKTPVFPIPKAKISRTGGIWITLMHVAKKGVCISRLIHFYLVIYI